VAFTPRLYAHADRTAASMTIASGTPTGSDRAKERGRAMTAATTTVPGAT
jgi:hypothetical protein